MRASFVQKFLKKLSRYWQSFTFDSLLFLFSSLFFVMFICIWYFWWYFVNIAKRISVFINIIQEKNKRDIENNYFLKGFISHRFVYIIIFFYICFFLHNVLFNLHLIISLIYGDYINNISIKNVLLFTLLFLIIIL